MSKSKSKAAAAADQASSSVAQSSQEVFKFKVIIIGESNVGKTSILNTLQGKAFNYNLMYTIGIDFVQQEFQFENSRVNLMLWDTAGQERYHTITTWHYRGSKAVIFVYDVTRPESFHQIRDFWIDSFTNNMNNEEFIAFFLIANKSDLSPHLVTEEMGRKLASDYNFSGFQSTSAKSGENINEVFEAIAWFLFKRNCHDLATSMDLETSLYPSLLLDRIKHGENSSELINSDLKNVQCRHCRKKLKKRRKSEQKKTSSRDDKSLSFQNAKEHVSSAGCVGRAGGGDFMEGTDLSAQDGGINRSNTDDQIDRKCSFHDNIEEEERDDDEISSEIGSSHKTTSNAQITTNSNKKKHLHFKLSNFKRKVTIYSPILSPSQQNLPHSLVAHSTAPATYSNASAAGTATAAAVVYTCAKPPARNHASDIKHQNITQTNISALSKEKEVSAADSTVYSVWINRRCIQSCLSSSKCSPCCRQHNCRNIIDHVFCTLLHV